MRVWCGAVLPVLLATTAYGQRLSFGAVGGTNITNNFPVTYSYYPGDSFGNPPSEFWHQSGPRSFIFGASLEAYFNNQFSLEANVLHRPMKNRIIFTSHYPNGSQTVDNVYTAVRAWQFPVLFKWTVPVSYFSNEVRPFLAAGPAFRTQEDVLATEPSQFGFSAGAGLTIPWGRFRIAPTIRYTRWQRESIWPKYATKPDQVEFLTSFSYETGPESRRIGGRKLEIGAILGLAFTDGIQESFWWDPNHEERLRYLAGLTVQTNIARGWSMEIGAIYRPFRVKGENPDRETLHSVLTWQFPVLAKYSFTNARWRPFVSGGPSFRLSGNLNGYDPSHFGVTAGAGMETIIGNGFRLAPAIRYTRWYPDANSFLRTNPNAVELVFGISF